jgi:hypothetical protein
MGSRSDRASLADHSFNRASRARHCNGHLHLLGVLSMSYEKHKVTTDALDTLGNIIDDKQQRDAIHLAVIPVEASAYLAPGWHVYIENGKAYACDDEHDPRGVGIVDPFLKSAARAGQWFWCVIYPRVITSLRHVWTHPQIPDTSEVSNAVDSLRRLKRNQEVFSSEQWLLNWCKQNGEISYNDLLEVARTGEVQKPDDDEYYGQRWSLEDYALMSYGQDAYASIPPELWDHVKNVIGQEPVARPDSMCCSC